MAYVQVYQEIRVWVVKEEMMRPSSRRSTSSNGSREDESSVVEQMFVSPIDTMCFFQHSLSLWPFLP